MRFKQFPGCEFSVVEDGGKQFVECKFTSYAVVRVGQRIKELTPERLGLSVLRDLATSAMASAAGISLPVVKADWAKFFRLGMALVDEHGEAVRVLKINGADHTLGIQWDDGKLAEMTFDAVLARLERREWKIPSPLADDDDAGAKVAKPALGVVP